VRPGATYLPAQIIRAALDTVRGVRVAAIARQAEKKQGHGDAIAAAIRAARLAALREWRRHATSERLTRSPPAQFRYGTRPPSSRRRRAASAL